MSSINPVEEVKYGVYVWEVEGAGLLVNEDGDPLRINSMKGDLSRIKELKEAAAYYGYPDGKAVFWSGRRAISDSEYQMQAARNEAGILADPYDIPALADQLRRQKADG